MARTYKLYVRWGDGTNSPQQIDLPDDEYVREIRIGPNANESSGYYVYLAIVTSPPLNAAEVAELAAIKLRNP